MLFEPLKGDERLLFSQDLAFQKTVFKFEQLEKANFPIKAIEFGMST